FDDFELSGLSSFGLGWQRRTHELEAAHAAALASANAAIASLGQREAALQLDVRQAQTRIAERDERIALLQAWLDERGAERDRLSHALDAMREERNRQVAGLEARLHEHAARYTALEAFSRQVEALYASVIASRSWRLTRPLRWIADGCRRWARVAHAKARPATEAPRRRLRAVLRRGIGRYSRGLAEALLRTPGCFSVSVALNGAFSDVARDLAKALAPWTSDD